jgi:hypothetical protein
MENCAKFLEESVIAERVKVPTRIVVYRSAMDPGSLEDIRESGVFAPKDPETCELEAGGQVLARGKIVKKGGEFFFKVMEMEEVES